MKKIFLIIYILLQVATIAVAHDATVKGTITGTYTKAVMAGVNVTLKGTAYRTTTDSAGNFSFINIPARDYTVVLKHRITLHPKETLILLATRF